MIASALMASFLLLGGTMTFSFKTGETNSVVAGSVLVVSGGRNVMERADLVSWGDGTVDTDVDLPATHEYSASPSSGMSVSCSSLRDAYTKIVTMEDGSVPAFSSVELDGIECLGSGCFAGYAITGVEFGHSLEWIERDAFLDCKGLVSVEIPNSVTNVSGNPFTGCDNLVSITVASGNPGYSDMGMNVVYDTEEKNVVGWCRNSAIPPEAELFDGRDAKIVCELEYAKQVRGYPNIKANCVGYFDRDLTRFTWEGGWPTGRAHRVFSWFCREEPSVFDPDLTSPVTHFTLEKGGVVQCSGSGGVPLPPIPKHLCGVKMFVK